MISFPAFRVEKKSCETSFVEVLSHNSVNTPYSKILQPTDPQRTRLKSLQRFEKRSEISKINSRE